MKSVFNYPKNEGYIVVFKDIDGKTYSTDYIYKQKWRAQQKADELMLIEQKEYYVTECIY